MAEPRKHHYVPRFYLERFCASETPNRLWRYDKGTGREILTKPGDLAVRRDYYRFDVPEDLKLENGQSINPFFLEEYFQEVESNAAPHLTHLVSGGLLKGEGRMQLAEFLAGLMIRGPAHRQFAADVESRIMMIAAEAGIATRERYESTIRRMNKDGIDSPSNVDYDDIFKFLKSNKFDIEISEQRALAFSMSGIEEYANLFYDMKMNVVRAGQNDEFITSDNPIRYGSPPSTHHPVYGDGGLMNKDVEVWLPLDRKHLLVLGWRGVTPFTLISGKYLERMNLALAANAVDYAIAGSPQSNLRTFMKKLKGMSRSMRRPVGEPKAVLRRHRREGSSE